MLIVLFSTSPQVPSSAGPQQTFPASPIDNDIAIQSAVAKKKTDNSARKNINFNGQERERESSVSQVVQRRDNPHIPSSSPELDSEIGSIKPPQSQRTKNIGRESSN